MRLKAVGKSPSVLVTLLLLIGAASEQALRPDSTRADGYHAKIRAESGLIANVIGDWEGSEMPVQPAAIALLRPNVILQRRYVNRRAGLDVSLLLVQCRDARDMAGHYPPVCYPANGWTMRESSADTWRAAGHMFDGVEYQFTRVEEGRLVGCYVRNLIILPDGRFARDIAEVRGAAGDFRRRFYGAAQVQLVMDDKVSSSDRDAVFSEIIGGNIEALRTLMTGGTR